MHWCPQCYRALQYFELISQSFRNPCVTIQVSHNCQDLALFDCIRRNVREERKGSAGPAKKPTGASSTHLAAPTQSLYRARPHSRAFLCRIARVGVAVARALTAVNHSADRFLNSPRRPRQP